MVGDDRLPPHSVVASGAFKNFNTIEDFKAADKTALFNEASGEVSLLPHYLCAATTEIDR
jgi:Ubiquitin-like modifier-activating enzyme ATG7 N-terminus